MYPSSKCIVFGNMSSFHGRNRFIFKGLNFRFSFFLIDSTWGSALVFEAQWEAPTSSDCWPGVVAELEEIWRTSCVCSWRALWCLWLWSLASCLEVCSFFVVNSSTGVVCSHPLKHVQLRSSLSNLNMSVLEFSLSEQWQSELMTIELNLPLLR